MYIAQPSLVVPSYARRRDSPVRIDSMVLRLAGAAAACLVADRVHVEGNLELVVDGGLICKH